MFNRILFTLFLLSINFLKAGDWYELALPSVQVMDMHLYKSQLWVATYGKGIFQYDYKQKTWKTYSTLNENCEEDFFYCIAVSDDYIWAGSSQGLYIYDRKKESWKKRKFSAGGEYGNWIRSLYYDSDEGVLWIGRFQFLSRLDVKRQKYDDMNMTMGTDDRSNNIKSVRPDGENIIWIGTESGAFRYDKKNSPTEKSSYEYFGNKEKAFNGEGDFVSISEIFSDDEGVWFATDEFVTQEKPYFNVGGLYKYNRKANWTKFDRRTGLAGNGVKTVARSGNRLWLGVYAFDKEAKTEIGQGLALLNPATGALQNIRIDELKAESNLIHSLIFDGDALWIGTDKGLYRVTFYNPFATFTKKKRTK